LRRYESSYFNSATPGQGYDEYLNARDNWLRTFNRRLDEARPYITAGRVLDVGCGAGYFLEAASQRGFDPYGIDLSDFIVQVAQKKFGDRIQQATLESAPFPAEHFDFITAFDTFEHIYDPLAFLESASRLLKPGGVMMITTPDCESGLARLSGRHWVSFKIPEHVFYWSPPTIRQAMKHRFKVLDMRSAAQYASMSFLVRRLFRIGTSPAPFLQPVLNIVSRINIYADNGSLTVFASRL